jgi:hypothetical protein
MEETDIESECVVCLNKKENHLEFLSCGHSYHQECIREWFKKSGKKECLECFRKHSQLEKIKKSMIRWIENLFQDLLCQKSYNIDDCNTTPCGEPIESNWGILFSEEEDDFSSPKIISINHHYPPNQFDSKNYFVSQNQFDSKNHFDSTDRFPLPRNRFDPENEFARNDSDESTEIDSLEKRAKMKNHFFEPFVMNQIFGRTNSKSF